MMRSKPTAWLSGLWLIALGSGAALADDDSPRERSASQADTTQSNQPGTKPPKPRKPSGKFVLGVGYSPDDGPVFSASVENDRLFGSNHGLSLSSELSRRHQEFRLRYDARRLFGSGVDARLELFDTRRTFTGFARHGTGGALRLSRDLSPTTRGYIGYRLEQTSIDTTFDATKSSLASAGLFDSGTVRALRVGMIYDTRDRAFAPRKGTRAEVFVERAHPGLGSDFDLTRMGASISHHRRLAGPFTLRVRGGASAVWSPSGGAVPLSERLQFDGHSDVRGYGFGSAGPTLFRDGSLLGIGGNAKASGRAEIEFPLIRRAGLSAAVFYDAAMVRDFDGFSAVGNGLYHSAGVSLIWRSPIGPLRFDWAIPLNRRDNRSGPAFMFSLGRSF